MNEDDQSQEREKRKRFRPKQKMANCTRFGKINLSRYFSYEVKIKLIFRKKILKMIFLIILTL